MPTKVKFQQWNCIAVFQKYRNNDRIAIELVDENDGDCIAFATINLSNENLAEGTVAIKDYSENEGMVEALTEAGIIGECVGYAQSGYAVIPIHKLLITE